MKSFETINKVAGSQYGTHLDQSKPDKLYTHMGTNISYTLATVTVEQIEAMLKKGSNTFTKLKTSPAQIPVKPPTEKAEEKTK